VNGLVYDIGLLGLLSREAGIDESCVPGPIEKAPLWFLGGAPVDSVERLVGAVWPDDPGRESSIFVVVGDVPGDEIWGVTAVGSSSVLTFWRGASLVVPSIASLDLVAAGVMGGECIEDGRGLW
jgi:hypothetical protein